MIIKRETMKSEIRDNMRGGEGSISITHLAEKDVLPHGRLMADIIIPVGASIGEHEHNDETEFYIILDGEGVVCDNGEDQSVIAGEVVVTPHGSSHSIRNTGSVPLKMIAVIITY